MDLATLIGMLGAIGIVLAAMLTGGSPLVFVNVPSLLIVLGGTFMVVMIKFSLSQFLGAFKVVAGVREVARLHSGSVPAKYACNDWSKRIAGWRGLLRIHGARIDDHRLYAAGSA